MQPVTADKTGEEDARLLLKIWKKFVGIPVEEDKITEIVHEYGPVKNIFLRRDRCRDGAFNTQRHGRTVCGRRYDWIQIL